jgi:hypothetical protein
VVAVGLAGQEHRPAEFDGLPSALVSHSSEHTRLDAWRGELVAVIGRGQSACESAALLKEAGSDVEIICRGDIRWRPSPHTGGEDWRRRLMRLARRSYVGPWPLNQLNDLPGVEHRMPDGARSWINARSLRAVPAWWLRPRLEGVRVHARRRIIGVKTLGNRVGLQLDDALRVYRHVLLATGYGIDLAKLRMLPAELRRRISCVDGAPVLGEGFQSTVAGLHFIGASAVASYGPLLAFIAGTGYAARSVTRMHLASNARARFESLAARAAPAINVFRS